MKRLIFILFSLIGLLSIPAFSQYDTLDVVYPVDSNDIRLFSSDEVLEMTLAFDIRTFRRKRSDTLNLPAVLTYYTSDTDSVTKELKVRARGEYRRTFCDLPPIRLNFKKSNSPDDEFTKIDKIKMVTHCKIGNEDYTLREYLVYKLYNALTDESYRVRLLKINYIDTERPKKPISSFAFLIEPTDLLAKRLNSIEVELARLSQKNIKPESLDRMAIFNYMIGNTDWSVPGQHNTLILSQPKSSRPDLGVIVPFDFDYAGFVNTDYATPDLDRLPIKDVRQRYYTGICRSEEVFLNAIKEFSDKKEEFYRIINEFPYLKERSKKDIIMFLNGFYQDFDRRNTIVYKILGQCEDF
jgi:hypothetical protein